MTLVDWFLAIYLWSTLASILLELFVLWRTNSLGEVRMLWVNLIPGVGISIIIIAFKIGIDALFPKRLPWE